MRAVIRRCKHPFLRAAARCEISRVVDSITLAEVMAKLTPNRREVVVHMYLHGRTPDEVSAVLGASRSAR